MGIARAIIRRILRVVVDHTLTSATLFFIIWFNAYPGIPVISALGSGSLRGGFGLIFFSAGSVLYGLTLVFLPYLLLYKEIIAEPGGPEEKCRYYPWIMVFVVGIPYIAYVAVAIWTLVSTSWNDPLVYTHISDVLTGMPGYFSVLSLAFLAYPLVSYLLIQDLCGGGDSSVWIGGLVFEILSAIIIIASMGLAALVDSLLGPASIIYFRGPWRMVEHLYHGHPLLLMTLYPTWGSFIYLYLTSLLIPQVYHISRGASEIP